MVVIPVYEDPADQESSPFNLPNANTFSWTWLSTVNRVNSQVQKVRAIRLSASCTRIDTVLADSHTHLRDHPRTVSDISRTFVVAGVSGSLYCTGCGAKDVHPCTHARLDCCSVAFYPSMMGLYDRTLGILACRSNEAGTERIFTDKFVAYKPTSAM